MRVGCLSQLMASSLITPVNFYYDNSATGTLFNGLHGGEDTCIVLEVHAHSSMCLSIAIQRPDDVLSKGEHLGFQWMTVHNGSGYRCGYVRLPAGHPWHGKAYDYPNVDVHGGITFAEADEPCNEPGPDVSWWIGFDCAHLGDAPDPELPNNALGAIGSSWMFAGSYGEIRSQDYVEAECIKLVEQAAAAQCS